MRLTLHTDYALRLLIFVAIKEGQRGTIREAAEAYGISRNHLMKVAHELQRKGYLRTIRGKGGGLVLGRTADDICVGDLVRAMEPDMNIAECFCDSDLCVITPNCRLRGMLHRALSAFLDTLDQFTLADILADRSGALRRDLGIVDVTPDAS